MNVAYGVCLENRTGEGEEEEGEGEIDYYYGVQSDRQQQDPHEPSSGFTDDTEAHYEVYRHS